MQLVQDEERDKQRRNAVSVPVIGNVAAGAPILAEQNIEEHVLLSPEMAQDGFFLLRVRGESMIDRLMPMLKDAGFSYVEGIPTRHKNFAFIRAR